MMNVLQLCDNFHPSVYYNVIAFIRNAAIRSIVSGTAGRRPGLAYRQHMRQRRINVKRRFLTSLLALAVFASAVATAGAAGGASVTVDVFYVLDYSTAPGFDFSGFPETLTDPKHLKLAEEVAKIDDAYRAERSAELEKALGDMLKAGGGPFEFTDSRGKSMSVAFSADPAQTQIKGAAVTLAVSFADTPENADIVFTLTSAPVPTGYTLIGYRDRPGRPGDNRAVAVLLIPQAGFPPIDYGEIAVPGANSDKPEPPATVSAAALTAKPTVSSVLVDGKTVAFDAYNIGGNNYFKLRDLAYALSGTVKQFEVGWEAAANAISLTSGKPYTAVGGEMTGKGTDDKPATPTNSKIRLDGKEAGLTAYNIGGANYFKLRDVGQAFNFGVTWDGAKNAIVIDTSKAYSPE
jgi:hypothetical protein